MALVWNLSGIFLMAGLGFGRRTTGEVRSHHTMSKAHAISVTYECDVDLDHLTEVASVGCLHCWLVSSSLRKEVTIYSIHLRDGESHSTSLRVELLHKLFGILLPKFVFSPLEWSFTYV